MARKRRRARRRRGGGGFRLPREFRPTLLSEEQREQLKQARAAGRPDPALESLRKQERKQRRGFREGFDLSTPEGALGAQLALGLGQQQQQELFNRLQQQGVFGSREFGIDPETGQRTVTDALSPELQGLLGQIQQQAGATAGQFGALGQPVDFQQFGAVPGLQDFAAERQRIEEDLFNRFNQQFDPIFQKQREDLESSLAGRGIPVGSELFDKQIRELEETQNRARTDARQQATEFAGQEQQRLFQGALTGRQQAIGETLQTRQQPLSELGALLGLQAGIPQPNFGPISQVGVQGVDIPGTFLGFGQLGLGQAQLAQQGDLARAQLAQAASQFVNPLAQISARGEEARKTAAFQSGLGSPGQSGGGGLSPFEQFAIAAGQGVGAGFGSQLF